MNLSPDERWLAPKEASAVIGVSVDTIRRLVAKNELKALRITTTSNKRRRKYVSLRIALSDLWNYIRRNYR